MMRRLVVYTLILLCTAVRAMAIDAIVSHTIFYQPDAAHAGKLAPVAETYFQVNPRTLHYTTSSEKKIIGRLKADIIFTNDAGIIKEGHYVIQTIPRADVRELIKNKIIDLRSYNIVPGMVRMKFALTDMADSNNRYAFSDSFTVSPAPANAPFFSGVQLLDTTIESTAETVFKKNGNSKFRHVPIS